MKALNPTQTSSTPSCRPFKHQSLCQFRQLLKGYMMRKVLIFLACLCAATTNFAANVEVDRYFQGTTSVTDVVMPGQFKMISIGTLKMGDQIAVQVDLENKVYNDITVCIASEMEAQTYSRQGTCRGLVKARTPVALRDQVQSDGKYFLVLDNSYAALIKKSFSVRISTRRSLSLEEVSQLKSLFQQIHDSMTSTFEKSDFNIYVRPCGESNAFSNNRTADITMCSELIHDMLSQGNTGALVAVLLHEYGHSLLNRWGEPGSSEEDMADQFATAMLLRGGDSGRRLLQGWISYWQSRDSRSEAVQQLQRGGTHTLSIQRARNIQNAMNFPEDFVRRWNKMLYRHMTKQGLQQVLAKPSRSDDIDLANEALRSK